MKNQGNHVSNNLLTRALGGLAIGLGAAQLTAPRFVARLIGVRPSNSCLGALRLLGVRASLSGLGLLRGRRPTGWLGWRLAGDVMDVVLLLRAMKGRWHELRGSNRPRQLSALAAVGGVAVLDAVAFAFHARGRRGNMALEPPTVTASVTIDRSAADLYAFEAAPGSGVQGR